MSIHLLEIAKDLKIDGRHITPTHKLALLCFADSGSAETRIARPGLESLLVWTCVKRSRALEVVKDLIELRLLERHANAYRGRNAEFVVFPDGCCERHGQVPADLRMVADEPVLSVVEKGSGTVDPFSTTSVETEGPPSLDPLDCPQGPLTPDPIDPKGSGRDPRKGPVETPERVRSSRSKWEPSKSNQPPKATTPTGHLPAQPTEPISLVFGQPLDSDGVWQQPTAARPTSCDLPNCEDGRLVNGLGIPVALCPRCRPAAGAARDEAAG